MSLIGLLIFKSSTISHLTMMAVCENHRAFFPFLSPDKILIHFFDVLGPCCAGGKSIKQFGLTNDNFVAQVSLTKWFLATGQAGRIHNKVKDGSTHSYER